MIDAIILAGGESTRFKQNKLLSLYIGKPLIDYAISGLSQVADNIIVVTGKYHKELCEYLKNKKVTVIENKQYKKGMFSSVLVGVSFSENDFFILPGDCPFVSVETYKKLVKTSADISVPSYNNKTGHPIFFKKHLKEELLKKDIDFNLKLFRNEHNYEIIDVTDKNISIDIDTEEDFQCLDTKLKGR